MAKQEDFTYIKNLLKADEFVSPMHKVTFDWDNEKILIYDRIHKDTMEVVNKPEPELAPNKISLGLNKVFDCALFYIARNIDNFKKTPYEAVFDFIYFGLQYVKEEKEVQNAEDDSGSKSE